MIEIRKTENFAKWLDGLHDIRARARILVRTERLTAGNPGDVKSVAGGALANRPENLPRVAHESGLTQPLLDEMMFAHVARVLLIVSHQILCPLG